MCKLFDPRESKHIEKCRALGEEASIEPLFDRCSYCGFIVEVHAFLFEELCKSPRARQAFILAVDRRIREQDFSDIFIDPASSELDPDLGPRVVFDSRGRVLMSWNT